MPLKTRLCLASCLSLLPACGDDGETDTNATSLGDTSGTTTSASDSGPTTGDPATSGPDDTTGDGPGQTDSSTGMPPETDSGTTSGSDGTSSGGDMVVNGCEGPGAAMDMTGMAMVQLDWQLGHQRCLVVDVGTVVRWSGSFGAHPLEGGETGTQDPASPVTLANGDTGTMVDVTFDVAGDYPYYCAIHLQGMQGVIYVQ